MRKIYLLLATMFGLLFIPSVHAECTHQDKVRLQKLAGNVLFSYDYHESDFGVTFDITVSNLTSDIYMMDMTTNKIYRSDNKDVVIKGYRSGSTIQFNFYPINEECVEYKESIFSNYVTLPNYNPFYKEDICKGVSEYKLCQKWMKMNISYTEFYKMVYQYKQTKKDDVFVEELVTDDSDVGEKLFYFWKEYYVYVIGVILIGCMIGYYLYNRSLKM